MSVLSSPLHEPMMANLPHRGVIDRLLLLWPTAAVATGAILLWIFGMAPNAAITFGLLAGCIVAVIWVMATAPTERLSDGLRAYDAVETPPRDETARPAGYLSSNELLYWIAAYYK